MGKSTGVHTEPRCCTTRFAAALIAGATGLLSGKAEAQATLPVNYGELVHTFEAPNNLGNVVVTLVNTTPGGLLAAPLGSNFLAPLYWNSAGGANAWTDTNLGQVYGVTLDGAVNPNIYVAAACKTQIYPFSAGTGVAFGPGGPGGVYRLNGLTGAICLVRSLPSDTASGLGNITYSATTNSLYVSNFADGLIYQLSLGTNINAPNCPATIASAYDHGVAGRTAFFGSTFAIADNGAFGITQPGRRVWGLAYNKDENRLYYGVWWEDSNAPLANENNEIWSVALNTTTGVPTGSSARREFAHPLYSGNYSNPAAGLNFTPVGTLLVGERTLGAHQSRLLEYAGGTTAWVPLPTNKYYVGLGNTSCSGAGDMEWTGKVWSAGDGIILAGSTALYGMMRIPLGGNSLDAPPTANSILIDSDQNTSQGDKTEIGTLVYRRRPCAPPPANMVLWMPFDETSGTTTRNRIYSQYPGTSSGGQFFSPGKVGNATCFDQGMINVAQYPNLQLGNDLTIDAWVSPNSQASAGWQHTIVDKRQSLGGGIWRGYRLYLTNAGVLTLDVWASTNSANTFSGPTLTMNGTWQHVAVTVRRSCPNLGTMCVDFYKNGVLTATPSVFIGGPAATSTGLRIGDSVDGLPIRWYVGCIDELEIFNRALSAFEIQTIWGAGPNGKCKTLCFIYPVDFNCDDLVDFFDYLDFVSAFASGSGDADFNGDGTLDFFDYLDFVNDFSNWI